jgi:hypothetical protein
MRQETGMPGEQGMQTLHDGIMLHLDIEVANARFIRQQKLKIHSVHVMCLRLGGMNAVTTITTNRVVWRTSEFST